MEVYIVAKLVKLYNKNNKLSVDFQIIKAHGWVLENEP
jgi:hypothetical protein